MKLHILASGSKGNAAVVEHNGSALLIDAGLPQRKLFRAIAYAGVDIASIDGLLLTHRHGDHDYCADEVCARFGIPLICPENAVLGVLRIGCGAFEIDAFPVPHDVSTLGFRIRLKGEAVNRLGWLTDLGHIPEEVAQMARECRTLFIEANHDGDVLQACGHPQALRDRISGPYGHLSNQAVADFMWTLTGETACVIAGHISETANDPQLAQMVLDRAVLAGKCAMAHVVASEECPQVFALNSIEVTA